MLFNLSFVKSFFDFVYLVYLFLGFNDRVGWVVVYVYIFFYFLEGEVLGIFFVIIGSMLDG